MKLAALRLHNVKRFGGHGVAIEGIGDGVNILSAANEFGKSTSFEALHGLFFQPHSSTGGDVRNLRPYSGGSPMIEADIAVGDARYRITKQYYAGRFAKVVDLATNRLLAQADEAENFIASLINGGAGGPTGLLWVRQGVTGIEQRSRAAEGNDRLARTSLLESVQGEVEAVTGGRRMAEIMAAVVEASAAIVTATGRPKTGGRYAAAIDTRDRLAADKSRLEGEVATLRGELDRRSAAQKRLAELENAEECAARQQAVSAAEDGFHAARVQADKLKAAEAEMNLAKARKDAAEREHRQFSDALGEAQQVAEDSREALNRREEAVERRRTALETIAQAQSDADAAEAEEIASRKLLDALEAATRARDAADRRADVEEQLRRAEATRGTIETCEARLAQVRLPATAVDELAELDIEIARIRAVEQAARPSVTIGYESATASRITLEGELLGDGEERGYDGRAELVARGIGIITLRSNRPEQDDGRLGAAEARRRTLLASMGVADLAAARAQQVREQVIEAEASEARAQLAILAPDGLDVLRNAAAMLADVDLTPIELKADPAETRAAIDAAEQRRRHATQTMRATEPARSHADTAFITAETALATLQTRDQQATAILGPIDERDVRGKNLAVRLREQEAALTEAAYQVDDLRGAALDLDAAEATLTRVRSVKQAAEAEIQQLRETIIALDARITARSDEAVEENWRQTADAFVAAEARVAAF